MNIVYENGDMVVTHSSGVVSVCSYDAYYEYVKSKSLQVDNLQYDLDKAKETLALIEASKDDYEPVT